MWSALAQLLPIALAAAVSTVPITITLVILLSDSRSVASVPYLVGCVLGGAVLLTLATRAAHGLPAGRPRQPPTGIGVLEVLVGGVLVVLGVFTLRRRRSSESSTLLGGRMRTIESLRRTPAFGLGLLMNGRPKALLLIAAASLIVRNELIRRDETAVAIAVYTLVATSTVLVPIVLTLAAPQRMEPRLVAARGWMAANGQLLSAGIMLAVGAFVLVSGIQNLS